MHREVTYRLIDYGDSVTQVGDVGDHIANDGGVKQRTQKEVGESNEAITIGAYATRVALRKESRGCEAVIMQLIDTKINLRSSVLPTPRHECKDEQSRRDVNM